MTARAVEHQLVERDRGLAGARRGRGAGSAAARAGLVDRTRAPPRRTRRRRSPAAAGPAVSAIGEEREAAAGLSPSWVTSSSRRRSTASATAPPPSEKIRIGTSWTIERAPTARKSPVRTYTWYGSTTGVIVRPTALIAWPDPQEPVVAVEPQRRGVDHQPAEAASRRGRSLGHRRPWCHLTARQAAANIRQTMYTIKEAAARSGVGAPLIRAWERRYGVVTRPARRPATASTTTTRSRCSSRCGRWPDSGWTASEAARAIVAGEVDPADDRAVHRRRGRHAAGALGARPSRRG